MRLFSRPRALLPFLWVALLTSPAAAAAMTIAECGGAVPCACGNRVVEDYTLTADIGPCPWSGAIPADELVGLRVDSDVTLDCNGFRILGPDDAAKEEFGIKAGSSTRPVSNATIKNCIVEDFWWGIHVTDSSDVVVEGNTTRSNGWFSATENGTGYGIDIANSVDVTVRNNQIIENGNEGIHLTASTRVLVEDNVFTDNGWEQVYVINADGNTLTGNVSTGGRQGLEMRSSDGNDFAYNTWASSPRQWLEDDNDGNTFVYDHFEGKLDIEDSSNANRFEYCSLENLSGDCVEASAQNNTFFKSYFECKKDVDTSKPLVLDRAVGADQATRRREIEKVYPGCSADMDLDGSVDAGDTGVVSAAIGTVVGDPGFDPQADLDHDGDVDAADLTAANLQIGPCDFHNRAPRPALKKRILQNNPKGSPDLVEFDASPSKDDNDAITRYHIVVRNRITDEIVVDQVFTSQTPKVTMSFSPGLYEAFATVTDDYGVTSRPVRRGLTVR